MTKLSNWFLALLLSTSSAVSFAVPITESVGNVDISGNTYALSILYDSEGNDVLQTFNALAPALTFFTEADATAAVDAMFAAFPGFDWNPGELELGGTRVAYSFSDSSYTYVTIEDEFFSSTPEGPFTAGRDAVNRYSFAEFDFIGPVSIIPAPTALVLFALGLAGLGFSRMNRLNLSGNW